MHTDNSIGEIKICMFFYIFYLEVFLKFRFRNEKHFEKIKYIHKIQNNNSNNNNKRRQDCSLKL